MESSKSYADVATTPAKNRQQQHYPQQQQQQQQQQRMSPFDELMAQHQQQLQRERQLLRLASGRQRVTDTVTDVTTTCKISIPPPPTVTTNTAITVSKFEDIPLLAEPPFEYSTPARSELPKKSLSETTADVKRGLLSSILEKVRSKEEAAEAAKTITKQRLMAPLASTESLSVSDASSKRLSTSVDSTASSKY